MTPQLPTHRAVAISLFGPLAIREAGPLAIREAGPLAIREAGPLAIREATRSLGHRDLGGVPLAIELVGLTCRQAALQLRTPKATIKSRLLVPIGSPFVATGMGFSGGR